MTALAPGHILGERFQLIRRLGEGGMGDVWLVEDLELVDRVVAKMVPRDATEDQLTLLRRECRHARKLVHSNIVPVYDFHRASGVCFFTMAYVDGTDIGSLRGRPIEDILPPLIAVADALIYAHARGIVHRDLKVSNVMIDQTGAPRLLDFGIAGLVTEQERSVDGILIRGGGSEGSASPQQLAGAAPSVTDDIYAFGVLARDLLSGQKLLMKLDALLNAAMNRDPRHRPQTMSDVKSALDAPVAKDAPDVKGRQADTATAREPGGADRGRRRRGSRSFGSLGARYLSRWRRKQNHCRVRGGVRARRRCFHRLTSLGRRLGLGQDQ